MVKIAKTAPTKAKYSSEDSHLALLALHSRQISTHLPSPATLVPPPTEFNTPSNVMEYRPYGWNPPRWLTEKVKSAMSYHDQCTHTLLLLFAGRIISILAMWRNIWIPVNVTYKLKHKSYLVRTTDGMSYCHTCKHLLECEGYPLQAKEMSAHWVMATPTITAVSLMQQCKITSSNAAPHQHQFAVIHQTAPHYHQCFLQLSWIKVLPKTTPTLHRSKMTCRNVNVLSPCSSTPNTLVPPSDTSLPTCESSLHRLCARRTDQSNVMTMLCQSHTTGPPLDDETMSTNCMMPMKKLEPVVHLQSAWIPQHLLHWWNTDGQRVPTQDELVFLYIDIRHMLSTTSSHLWS